MCLVAIAPISSEGYGEAEQSERTKTKRIQKTVGERGGVCVCREGEREREREKERER